MILQASAREIPMEDGSVQLVCTSPPFFGLRKYAGAQDEIWGGAEGCRHLWQPFVLSVKGKRKAPPIEVKSGYAGIANIEPDAVASGPAGDPGFQASAGEKGTKPLGKSTTAGEKPDSVGLINASISIQHASHKVPSKSLRNVGEPQDQALARNDTVVDKKGDHRLRPEMDTEGCSQGSSAFTAETGARTQRLSDKLGQVPIQTDKTDLAILSNIPVRSHEAEQIGTASCPASKEGTIDAVVFDPESGIALPRTDDAPLVAQMPGGAINEATTDHAGHILAGFAIGPGEFAPVHHTVSICEKCGAVKCALGLEPTVEMYVDHLVEICREVRRVLRDDGVFFLDCGDSYASNWGMGALNRDSSWWSTRSGEMEGKGWGHVKTAIPPNQFPNRGPGLKVKDLCGVPWRVALALQGDGWWLRDVIAWVKGLSFCDSYSGSVMPGSQRDRCTSAWEPVFMFTKSAHYYWDWFTAREQGEASSMERAKYPWYGCTDDGSGGSRTGSSFRRMAASGEGMATIPPDNRRTWRNAWAINPRPSNWDYCGACDALYVGGERKTIRKERADGKVTRWCPKCGKTDGWVDHFAAFCPDLIRPMVRAATSEAGWCAECGKAWEREVDVECRPNQPTAPFGKCASDATGYINRASFQKDIRDKSNLGFRPACSCNSDKPPVPCVVLDPFSGSGTTVLVADELGRTGIGLDVSEPYCKLARKRLERQRTGLVEWVEEEEVGAGRQKTLF